VNTVRGVPFWIWTPTVAVLTGLPITPRVCTAGADVDESLGRKYWRMGVGGVGGVMRKAIIRASRGGVGVGIGVGVATGCDGALKMLSS
jgi:hypothetical protein